MNIDFSQGLVSLDKKPLLGEGGKPLTLGNVSALALNVPEGPEPLRRGMMAMRLYDAGENTEITPEEAALIRDFLPKFWAPIVAAQAYEMLGG